MSSYKSFTKNIGLAGFTDLARILKGIIILPFIAKLLGPASYGIWAQIGVTIGLLSPAILLGLPYSLVRFLPAKKNKSEIQEGFYSVLLFVVSLGIILALILILFSSFISSFFQCNPALIKILGAVILFQSLNSVIANSFRAFSEIKKFAFFSISQSFGEALLVISAVFFGFGIPGAVAALLVSKIIFFVLGFCLIFKKIKIKMPDFSNLKEYLSFGVPLFLGSISYWIVTCSDRYLIGWFMGITQVGYYSPAYTVGNAINFFILPFIIILPPTLAKLFDEHKTEEVKKYLGYSLKYFLALALPAVLGISVLSKPILNLFSTQEISQNAFFITPFVAAGILFYGISNIFIRILGLVKKTKIMARIWTASAFLNIALNLALIPALGILGAAITTLISYVSGFFLIYYYSKKEFTFKIDWLFIAKIALASILMALAISFIKPLGLIKTSLAIGLGALIYLILMVLFRAVTKKELNFAKSFIKQE